MLIEVSFSIEWFLPNSKIYFCLYRITIYKNMTLSLTTLCLLLFIHFSCRVSFLHFTIYLHYTLDKSSFLDQSSTVIPQSSLPVSTFLQAIIQAMDLQNAPILENTLSRYLNVFSKIRALGVMNIYCNRH